MKKNKWLRQFIEWNRQKSELVVKVFFTFPFFSEVTGFVFFSVMGNNIFSIGKSLKIHMQFIYNEYT